MQNPAALLGVAPGDLAVVASNLFAPGLTLPQVGACVVHGTLECASLALDDGAGGGGIVDVDAFLRLSEFERVRDGTLCNVHFAAGAVPELAEAVAPVSVGGTGEGGGGGGAEGALVFGGADGGLPVPQDPAAVPRWVDGGLVLPAALRFEGTPLYLAPSPAAGGALAILSSSDPALEVPLAAPGGAPLAYVPPPAPTLAAATPAFVRLSYSNARVSWETPPDSPAPPARFATCGYSESNRPRAAAEVLAAAGSPLSSVSLAPRGGPERGASLVLDAPHASLAVVSESALRVASRPLLLSWGNEPPGVSPGAAPPGFASLTLRFSASNRAHGAGNGPVRLLAGALLADPGGAQAAAPLPAWLPPDLRPDPTALPDAPFRLLRSLEPLLAAGGAALGVATVPPGGSLEAAFELEAALVWEPVSEAWAPAPVATEYTRSYRPFVLAVDGFDNAALADFGVGGFISLPSADIDLRFPAVGSDAAVAEYQLLSTIKGVRGALHTETDGLVVLDLGDALPRVQGVHALALSNLAHTTHYSVRLAGCNTDDSTSTTHCNFRTLDVAPPRLLLSGTVDADGGIAVAWRAWDSNDGEIAAVHLFSGAAPPAADSSAALALLSAGALQHARCNNGSPPGAGPGAEFAGAATLLATLPTQDHHVQAVGEDRAADLFGAASNLLAPLAHVGAEVPRLTAAAPAAPLGQVQLVTRHRNAIKIQVSALADASATGPAAASALLLTPAAAAAFGLLDTPLTAAGSAAAHSNHALLHLFQSAASTAPV